MAKALDVQAPSKFSVDGDPTSLAPRWKKWRDGFNLYLRAVVITDTNQKKALLLHCGGEGLQEVLNTLPEPEPADNANSYNDVVVALNAYFLPKQNKRYERHVFRGCSQTENDTISQYVTRLRMLAKTCDFADTNDELVDLVIEKCTSRKLRKSLLKESDLTVAKLLELAHISETTEHQAKQYVRPTATC